MKQLTAKQLERNRLAAKKSRTFTKPRVDKIPKGSRITIVLSESILEKLPNAFKARGDKIREILDQHLT